MTELEHAEYRLMMRSGVRPATAPVASYYLVGFTHGMRRGQWAAGHDALAVTIRQHDPAVVLHDPLNSSYVRGVATDQDAPGTELRRQTALAAASTVCVAWLPDQEWISDAAAELQAAYRGDSTVVAITEHRDDFLVRAFASVILPDVRAFTDWIRQPAAYRAA